MMKSENVKSDRPFEKLGLPPMELAEPANERSSRCLYRCVYPTLQKVLAMFIILLFSAGLYVLVFKILYTAENTQNTEIILVTGTETRNITIHQNDWEIWFQLHNQSDTTKKRKKRDILYSQQLKNKLESLKDDARIKDIVLKHNTLCHEEKHQNTCAELMSKLHSIINENEETMSKPKDIGKVKHIKDMNIHDEHDMVPRTEVLKRHVQHPLEGHPHMELYPPHHRPIGAVRPLPDTCLLARLLKQQYPHAQEVYDPSNNHIDSSHRPHMRNYQPSMPSFTQSRENEKLHPQDFNIFMNFFKTFENSPKKESKKSGRAIECPVGSLPCDNSEDCIEESQWCDGNVDCADASDEIRCNCKARVDKSRLCDGYFDCPLGEDEMGCFGCSPNTFSCGNTLKTCFTKEQRCNSINDCPNHKDELECNMLAPNLDKKPLFAISNTEGYLHRNFKGDWYPVCQNPYMWAHDACRREAGLIIRPPVMELIPIDPTVKVTYMNTGPGGLMQTSDACFNSSAVYVTCPDFLCGTRVRTSTQLLENMDIENHLFGRNKRFLYPSFNPYRALYYGNRMKRDTSVTPNNNDDTKINTGETSEESSSASNNRMKIMEERVVGGKPSQPAAWPWVVAIYRDGMFHCGGVIMTQSWIISAAHCLHQFWDHYYEVQVGMLRRFSFSPQEQNYRVAHVIVNHQYNHIDMKGDLSLLKVEPAIQFSRWVRPICLPGPNTAGHDWMWGPAPGTVCTAVGWGATVEHGPDPDHLREVELPIWEQCKHTEDRAGKEICAGPVEGGKDACQGDSGGPLLCRNPLNSQQWFLAGIVSHGDGCARKGEPGVYTRVSLFAKWIKYHTTSKTLPRYRPKQECPGFKCLSGISKCLPNTRKCDKIIDCLDADDETSCDFMRSSENVLKDVTNTTKTEKLLGKSSREVEMQPSDINTLNVTNEAKSTNIIDVSTTEKNLEETISVYENTTSANVESDKNLDNTMSSTNLIPDFAHASTIKISPTQSSEEVDIDNAENVTDDPSSMNSDSNIFAVTFNPGKLESRSVILSTEKQLIETTTNIAIEESTITKSTITPVIDLESQNSERSEISAQKSRGDSSLEQVITTENNLLEFVTEPDSNPKPNNANNKTETLIIEFLPQTNNETTPNINKSNNETEEIKVIDDDSISAKILPDAEGKIDVLQKIEDLVFSELQPASVRRKHLIPKEFECRRIFQVIPYNRRCDRKADCEDGTDELDCTCTDYLSAFDQKLICDGIFDCADGQDESNCYSCPEDHFLCKRSEICLPMKYVCDATPHCPLGEDEQNCFALTNGKEMFYDIDEKPKINIEGFVTKRQNDDWQVVCDDKLGIEEQEETAAHICRYLGFSSANRYYVKYLNMKKEDIVRFGSDTLLRRKRDTTSSVPIHFTFIERSSDNRTTRNIVIKEPQLLKEECVPNITKTCKSLYVFCDRALYTNFEFGSNAIYNRAVETMTNTKTAHTWPWIAKVFVEGGYKCTGILVDLAWVLVSDSCLWDTTTTQNFVTVVLGSHRTLNSTNGWFEQVRKVDAQKDLYKNRVVLLHLKQPAQYSNMVKPMAVSSPGFHPNEKTTCVAIGQDNNNHTITLFLNETTKDCKLGNRCFIRTENENICPDGSESHRNWSGLISCHGEQGWYPAASFVDSRGECGLGDHIVATDIENLRQEIKYYTGKVLMTHSSTESLEDECQGIRCARGKCVPLRHMCDGVSQCEDSNDESDTACLNKRYICSKDPHIYGCECTSSEMKCKNGTCISKTLFGDGNDDCGDGTDEPMKSSCSDYLARVMPSKLCDGTLHCHDRSDENPMFCKCFAKEAFKCQTSSGEDYCVASDMVCDGVRDCPNGEDERNCIGLSATQGTPYGTGQVIVRSHGVWHAKCYPTQNHTKSGLEAICRDLGFLSGHAKQINDNKYVINSHNNLIVEPFREVVLNNQTVIKMRNTNTPVVARAIFDGDIKNCFPVVIECL